MTNTDKPYPQTKIPNRFSILNYIGVKKGSDLRIKSLRGVLWLGIAGGLDNGLRLIRNVILARILAPEDFGVMAIVLSISMLFETLTNVGVGYAIVQNPDSEDKRFLNGVWWFSAIRGLLLYSAAFIGSPYIAEFFSNPDLVVLMRVVFLGLLFNGIASPRTYIAEKKMEFHKLAIIRNGSGFLGVFLAIILSFIYVNVWALVVGFLAETVFRTILSFIVCPYLPKWEFEKTYLQSFFKYARGMAGVPILTFIYLRADIFAAGKLLPIAQLGLYSLAASFSKAPYRFIMSITNRISMPLFSELQNDPKRLNKNILEITKAINLLGIPMVIIVFILPAEILTLTYGKTYASVALPFSILFASEHIRISGSPLISSYFALGLPEANRLFTGLRAAIMLIIIVPAIKLYGLTGAAIAGVISVTIAYGVQLIKTRSVTGLSSISFLKTFSPIVPSVLIIVTFWLSGTYFFGDSFIIKITFSLLGCFFTYLFLLKFYTSILSAR